MSSIKESESEKTQVKEKTTKTTTHSNRIECLGNKKQSNDEKSVFQALLKKN